MSPLPKPSLSHRTLAGSWPAGSAPSPARSFFLPECPTPDPRSQSCPPGSAHHRLCWSILVSRSSRPARWLGDARGSGGRRLPALRVSRRSSRSPTPASPAPSPRPGAQQPAAAQTYLRVGGRGLRRAVRAPQRRVRPSRWGRAALALRSRGRARTALSLTQPGSAPAAVAAAGAAERLQTCSVSGPARVEATKSHPRRGRRRQAAERRPRAGGDHAGGPGKRGAKRC